ncbi:hypothetical protein RSW78_26515, partial [Escherichia coli]|uniref:hypothetical protein n=1 Tax=Escherichia coli TaxID=562 RepID=UPI0028DD96CF
FEVDQVLHGVGGFDPPGGHQASQFWSKRSPKSIRWALIQEARFKKVGHKHNRRDYMVNVD